MKNNLFKIILIGLIAFLSARVFLFATDVAPIISEHPIISLVMRLIFLAMFAFLIVSKRKENFVYCFLLTFPFLRLSFNGISLLAIFSALLLILYFREIIICIRCKRHIFIKPMVVLGLFMFLSVFKSNHKMIALGQLLFFIFLFSNYLVFVAFCDTEKKTKIFFKTLLVVNGLGVLVSIYQVVFGINSIKFFFGEYAPNVGITEFVKRVPSFFFEAQGAGLYFAIMIVLGIACVALFFRKSLLFKLIIILSMVGLLLTGTRIALLAFIVGLFFIFLSRFSLNKFIFALCALITLGCLGNVVYEYILPIQVKQRITRYELKQSSRERFKIWTTSFPIIKHHPLGVGLARDDLFDVALHEKSYLQDKYFYDPELRTRMGFESSFLDLLYSLGFFGFIIYLWLLWAYFKEGFGAYFRINIKSVKFFIVCLLASMLIWLIGSATSERCYDVHSMVIFVILFAILNAILSIYRPDNS